MDILREFEIRLLDAAGQVTLVWPVIAPGEKEAMAAAAALAAREKAAGYLVRPHIGSPRNAARPVRKTP